MGGMARRANNRHGAMARQMPRCANRRSNGLKPAPPNLRLYRAPLGEGGCPVTVRSLAMGRPDTKFAVLTKLPVMIVVGPGGNRKMRYLPCALENTFLVAPLANLMV